MSGYRLMGGTGIGTGIGMGIGIRPRTSTTTWTGLLRLPDTPPITSRRKVCLPTARPASTVMVGSDVSTGTFGLKRIAAY